jgi:hypothetical protein
MATPETVGAASNPKTLLGLTARNSYTAIYINPCTGEEARSIDFTTDDGRKPLQEFINTKPAPFSTNHPPEAPSWEDWVLIVRPSGAVRSVNEEPW